jgi:hypothetical protein
MCLSEPTICRGHTCSCLTVGSLEGLRGVCTATCGGPSRFTLVDGSYLGLMDSCRAGVLAWWSAGIIDELELWSSPCAYAAACR